MSELIVKERFAKPVDSEKVAHDWQKRGYTCEPFVDPPGHEWLDFVHPTNELVTVVEGRLELDIAGTCIVAGPGDEVFIPKGATHSVRNVHSGTTRWLFGYD